MVDIFINKYLETQLALSKQKQQLKDNKSDSVSQKSKAAAETISKKQGSSLVKSLKQAQKDDGEIWSKISDPPAEHGSDSDDEYLPSCDEEESIHLTNLPSSSRDKEKNLKKIIDDGDTVQYNARVNRWKTNLSAATSGNSSDGYISADIQYILDGNNDPNELHELSSGFQIPNFIWKQLYKYQRTGVKWLWELHQIESGGLLGDEMGLGKTVQIIAFLAGLSKSDNGSWGGLGPSIIVAPATVIYQWVSHFHYWYPHLRVAVLHHSGSHAGTHNTLIKNIHLSHGILLITYAGIVKYTTDLFAKKWHYIILDEGHKIRNPDTQVSKLVKKFTTPHKLLITGSPMQNSLQELWSLFDFMRPGLLGTHLAFMEHFAVPITQGGYANATEFQEATALEIAKALKVMITPYMLRRTKTEVQEHIKLPEKNEQVLFCALSKEQRDLYMGYLMSGTVRSILDKDQKSGDPYRARFLVALSTLRKICNHPDLYLYEAQDESDQIDEEKFGNWRRSGKMSVVHSLLKIWQKQGHRCLMFSQSRAMLCILEHYLQGHNFKYLKMDGSVNVGLRQNIIKTFNEDSQYLVFLATTRVGGLGVNLTGADRVIIYDPDWNPATDNQAKERAWRIGQLKNVTVYRLLSAGTVEEKIYQRQIFKNFLSNKILIDPNQKNVLTTSTLQGLFTLENLNSDGDTETASLFKHTKVDMHDKKENKNDKPCKISYAKKKLEAMKKMAKEISKRIQKDVNTQSQKSEEDPREKYKQKRELLLYPPAVVEKPEVNLIDEKVTTVSFDNALSEVDIINKHIKVDYEENLLKVVLINQDNDNKTENSKSTTNEIMECKQTLSSTVTIESCNHSDNAELHKDTQKGSKKKSGRKRKHSTTEVEIDGLVAVKKIKSRKRGSDKDKIINDDDYVLSKLFAKANVKNALHHDVVVGLAEKENKHRMKEEAIRQARKAVRAVKFSSK